MADSLRLGPQYLDISSIPGVRVDLRYASTDNFTGEDLYAGRLTKAYLHADAAEKLVRAVELVRGQQPQWSFLVFDALRPRSVQRRMWNHVKDTPQKIYVADPDRGSMHNFGLAIDLTLADESGGEVDMGTPFDSFQELAQPRHEERFLASGDLTLQQVGSRRLLRESMREAGFQGIPHEWWHFNAVPFAEAKARYSIIE